MGMGGGGGTNTAVSEINVTPLIDVLLVLLIIFMVIVPVVPRGLDSLVPQPPKTKTETPENDKTIVVQVLGTAGAPSYKINDQQFNKSDLKGQLSSIFAVRNTKVMFVKGDPDMYYGSVAEVIDIGHAAGVESIGIITPKVEAGN